MENYTEFAYERFKKKRTYIWGRYTKFYRKKINFKNKKVLDFGCGNILTSSTAKFFKEENKNSYGKNIKKSLTFSFILCILYKELKERIKKL